MLVAASTACFPDLALADAFDRLVDLEYTAVEIAISDQAKGCSPAGISDRFDDIVMLCRMNRRLTAAAYFFDCDAETDEYCEHFKVCCRLAKATKVVSVGVRSSERGTPFNEEVERLRRVVEIAKREGVVVGLMTELTRMSCDPETVDILCRSVPGLQVTLDPSHFVYGDGHDLSYDSLLDRVCHVRLRDSRRDAMQVRVGQGMIEYGRLVTQLRKVDYNRTLCVDLRPLAGVEQTSEMRKLRLLLESLL